MTEKDQGKAMRIDFNLPEDFPSKYASNLVVQHTEHDFTITFLDIRPPLLVGTATEKAMQIAAVDVVKAAPVARIIVAASRMSEFVQVLRDNLKTFEATMAAKSDKQPAKDGE